MNSKTKIRLFYTLEVVVWLLVIVICVGTIRFYQAKKQNQLQTYRIFMQDVDGLIEGSSVRMMGVPIGYIKTINIVQDQVYVKFVLTDKNVTLPQGVIATVEFNGMAGSKSLEIYPPDSVSKASGNLITIKKTNRLGAALGLFDDMFAKLDSIIVRCNHFSGELDHIIPKYENTTTQADPVKSTQASVGLLNNLIEKLNHSRIEFMQKLKPKHKIIFDKKDVEEVQPTEEKNSNGQE